MVYIGTTEHPLGRMKMSHMSSENIEELHKMADLIGIKRKWFQNSIMPYYNISRAKKKFAIKEGAVLVEDKELISLCRPKF